MEFAIGAVVLGAAVAGALLLALRARPRDEDAAEAEREIEVYRAQLREVARDRARGVVSDAEAEALEAEIGRRLLAADRAQRAGGAVRTGQLPRAALALSVLAALAAGGAVYLAKGAPGYPDQPLAVRLAELDAARKSRPAQAEVEAQMPAWSPPPAADPAYLDLVEKLRKAVASRPDDPKGQALLARHEANLGNWRAARDAQARLIALRGEKATAEDYTQLAWLMVMAAGGYVSPEAEKAVLEALNRDPADPFARFLAGLTMAQGGRADIAYDFWLPLMKSAPADAPWRQVIVQELPAVAELAGRRLPEGWNRPAADLPGPDAGDVAAAQQMSAEDRQAMIEGMVARLAERLDSDGGSAEEHARLIRAYGVLGRTEDARAAWMRARKAFADDAEALSAIDMAARAAGLVQ